MSTRGAWPFDVAIEILSPYDPFSRTEKKCKLYRDWGIRHVFVIDGEERILWKAGPREEIQAVDEMNLDQERSISAQRIWGELDQYLSEAAASTGS
jgi:Uma2 family endonuclease